MTVRDEIAPPWRQHIGLIIGGVTSVLIVLKLLAVAGWNTTTALGILSAGGTANVLTGTLLASLPALYAYAYIWLIPRVERRLSKKTPVERAAARLATTWPSTLLMLVVPAHLAIGVLLFLVFLIIIRIRERRPSLKRKRSRKKSSDDEDRVSRFEAQSVSLGVVVMISFWSLSVPWLPAEIVELDGTRETAYVIDSSDNQATVLVHKGRTLRNIDAASLTGEYCQLGTRWLIEPFITLAQEPRYSECP